MSKPLVVQSDHSILLDVHDDGADSARADIIAFSELVKSPEHLHTYKISALSLWNAASAGLSADEVLSRLENHSRFAIPQSVLYYINETLRRFGSVVLLPFDEKNFLLQCRDEKTALLLERSRETAALIKPAGEDLSFLVSTLNRGEIKLRLLALGYPVDDQIPLKEGNELRFSLRNTTRSGLPFAPRGYQEEAISSFFGDDGPGTGYGTIVLPCGSGKTVVGLLAMAKKQTDTLILAPNVAAVHQWINEILDKTTLTENEVGEYSGEKKRSNLSRFAPTRC
jgi:DNA or RNA helicases of superfamily II